MTWDALPPTIRPWYRRPWSWVWETVLLFFAGFCCGVGFTLMALLARAAA